MGLELRKIVNYHQLTDKAESPPFMEIYIEPL